MENFEFSQLIPVDWDGGVRDALLKTHLTEDPQQACSIFANEFLFHSLIIALGGRDGRLKLGLLLLNSLESILQQLEAKN